MQNRRMNLRLFDTDANIIDRTGAESLIPIQESNDRTVSSPVKGSQAGEHDKQAVQNAGTGYAADRLFRKWR